MGGEDVPSVPRRAGSGQVRAIQGMFFLSGMGALVFETVWFAQAGLVVGNSVWSAALTVGAFMAGLALGNAAAVMLARRWTNLVRGYGGLEAVAAVSGALVVLAFPHLSGAFHPLLAPLLDEGAELNAVRIAIAFCLMVIPATALGATLPLLSKPLEAATGSYGYALGGLYAVNTLGAVAGALLAELALVPWLGLRGSGLVAAACNLSAALLALRFARQPGFRGERSTVKATRAVLTAEGARIVAAAALAGGILLALEVVWFRFLLLFQAGTTLVFAMMLAVVLAGIGLGGVIASWWSRRGWSAGAVARLAAAGGAAGVVACYAGFDAVWNAVIELKSGYAVKVMLLSTFLMAPASVLSGVLFTALGDHLRSRIPDAAAATGVLTFANTLGAMAGSLLAAFFLLPRVGMEHSFFLLAALYGAVILVIPAMESWQRRLAPAAAAALALMLFPFGQMTDTHYRRVEARYGARLVAAREGVVETAFYLAHEFKGEPLYYRLVTNAYSMSATALLSERYMKQFVYLPAALHPKIERALLICFGVGATASALTDLPDATAIDVVDVSRDILEMSDIPHSDPARHPLRDRRVATRVEDGRFFLQHTDRRYDLITGEPPPPKIAGVVSLYSREYFELLRARLNPGGLVTYWLPAHQVVELDTLAIIRAFCDAFEDCSLWSGTGLDWILVGSRDGLAPVPRDRFARAWVYPRMASELRRIGIPDPAGMVAQFMADAGALRELTRGAPPLTDNHPQRISPSPASGRVEPLFAWLMDPERGRQRLEASPWASRVLPPELVAESRARFRERAMLDAILHPELQGPSYNAWTDIAALLHRAGSSVMVQWLLDSDARRAEISARAAPDAETAQHLAIDSLAHRRLLQEDMDEQRFAALTPMGQAVTIFRDCLAGQRARARSLMKWVSPERRQRQPLRSLFAWAGAECS